MMGMEAATVNVTKLTKHPPKPPPPPSLFLFSGAMLCYAPLFALSTRSFTFPYPSSSLIFPGPAFSLRLIYLNSVKIFVI